MPGVTEVVPSGEKEQGRQRESKARVPPQLSLCVVQRGPLEHEEHHRSPPEARGSTFGVPCSGLLGDSEAHHLPDKATPFGQQVSGGRGS